MILNFSNSRIPFDSVRIKNVDIFKKRLLLKSGARFYSCKIFSWRKIIRLEIESSLSFWKKLTGNLCDKSQRSARCKLAFLSEPLFISSSCCFKFRNCSVRNCARWTSESSSSTIARALEHRKQQEIIVGKSILFKESSEKYL